MAKTKQELLQDAGTKHAEAKKIMFEAGDAITPEQETQVQKLLGEYDNLVAKADLAGRIEAGEKFLDAPDLSVSASSWRQASPDEGNFPIDAKAWRSIKVNTPLGEKEVRFHIPLAVQKNGYAAAFESYIREGKEKLGPNDRKTLSEGVDSAGGFLVPEEYHTELIKKVAGMTAIRPNARVVQTSRDVAKWPRIKYTTDDKYTSGVRLSWTGESPASSTAHRVTDPVFGLYIIPVHTALASMPISNDLIEDAAFDVVGISSDLIAEAFALGEDDAFVNGNGVARPMGILSQVDTESGPSSIVSGSASAVAADGIVDLYFGLPAQYRRNAKFYMNSATQKAVEKLKDSQNRYLVSSLVNGSLATPQFDTLKGKPIQIDEFAPDVAGNAYPLFFGDLSGYMICDRVGLSVQRLSELYAETNVTLLLARKRVGGQLVEPWRVKAQKIST